MALQIIFIVVLINLGVTRMGVELMKIKLEWMGLLKMSLTYRFDFTREKSVRGVNLFKSVIHSDEEPFTYISKHETTCCLVDIYSGGRTDGLISVIKRRLASSEAGAST